MTINDVEFEVGRRYLIDDVVKTPFTLVDMSPASDEDNPYLYLVNEAEDISWELWFGKTEDYTVEGWHGVDGEEEPDGPGAVIVPYVEPAEEN